MSVRPSRWVRKDYLLKYEMTSENIVKLLMDYGCCAAQTNGPTRDEQLLLGISGQKVENMTGYLLCARYMGSRPLIVRTRTQYFADMPPHFQ